MNPLHPIHSTAPPLDLLESIEGPTSAASVALTSGRRIDVTVTGDGDRIEMRGRRGEVVLRVLLTEAGPVLSFEAADIQLASKGELLLTGRDVRIRAERDLVTEAGGDARSHVSGDRHTTVRGAERLEAHRVELQANEENVAIRAREDIKLDAEHIGLNDDPVPAPFPWSAAAGEDEGGAP